MHVKLKNKERIFPADKDTLIDKNNNSSRSVCF